MMRTTMEFHTEWAMPDGAEDERCPDRGTPDERPTGEPPCTEPASDPQKKPGWMVAGM